METSHREKGTDHTAAIFEEITAMICDGLQCLWKLKTAGKWPISLYHVAGPYSALIHYTSGPVGMIYMTYQKALAISDYLAFTLRSAITECIHKTMAIDHKAA